MSGLSDKAGAKPPVAPSDFFPTKIACRKIIYLDQQYDGWALSFALFATPGSVECSDPLRAEIAFVYQDGLIPRPEQQTICSLMAIILLGINTLSTDQETPENTTDLLFAAPYLLSFLSAQHRLEIPD